MVMVRESRVRPRSRPLATAQPRRSRRSERSSAQRAAVNIAAAGTAKWKRRGEGEGGGVGGGEGDAGDAGGGERRPPRRHQTAAEPVGGEDEDRVKRQLG